MQGAFMRSRKLVAVLAAASLAFWAPSIVPIKAGIGQGFAEYRTIDTAYAVAPPPPVPAFYPTSHAASPWPVVAVFVATASVMLNAAIVWNTQCRELTLSEAATSAILPLVGIAFDAQASKCHH
jgi:hypothetical protein